MDHDASHKVPQGRLGRLARLAATGVRTGAQLLLDRGDASVTARQTAEVLGTLRGLAAKVGQMASYVDGVIPEEHRDTYETAMKGLRNAAPPSSAADIRHAVEQELGAPVDALFAAWEDVPIASASIGQVHRARLHDGRTVAVKVQHPGIVRAVEHDLANTHILESMIGLAGGRRFGSDDIVEQIRTRFREELDYRLEAERIELFREIHAHEERIRIPAVVHDHSARHVLTTEFVEGLGFDAACAATEDEREAWARTLWRFVFRGNLKGRHFNADPHPGNYLFQPDGVVTFLDFGCVQRIAEPQHKRACDLHRAALARDEAAFRTAGAALLEAKPGRMEVMTASYLRHCFEPLFRSPFRFTRDYAASCVDEMASIARESRKLPEREFFVMPPEMTFMNRLQFGFYSVLARLDVSVDYHAVESAFLHEFAS